MWPPMLLFIKTITTFSKSTASPKNNTPTPLNLPKCLSTGGFLQTAASDAPRTTWRTYLRSVIGRIRYGTSVYG
jgi:hypothetical protein